jgi:hypothetical protein
MVVFWGVEGEEEGLNTITIIMIGATRKNGDE